jgi:hypothetical protein
VNKVAPRCYILRTLVLALHVINPTMLHTRAQLSTNATALIDANILTHSTSVSKNKEVFEHRTALTIIALSVLMVF